MRNLGHCHKHPKITFNRSKGSGMKFRAFACSTSLLALSVLTVSASAGTLPPEQDIGPRHPHLQAAQSAIRSAYDELSAAQRANEHQLSGHADAAKRLLDQASAEVKQAARTANAEGR
jgi:hypothetical protein